MASTHMSAGSTSMTVRHMRAANTCQQAKLCITMEQQAQQARQNTASSAGLTRRPDLGC